METTKNLTYVLIISQLKNDGYFWIANELEEQYFSCKDTGYFPKSICPSADLQKIIAAHEVWSDVIMKTKHILDDGGKGLGPTRRPNSFFDCKKLTTSEKNLIIGSSEAVKQSCEGISSKNDVPKLKRGRMMKVEDNEAHISSELQQISQQITSQTDSSYKTLCEESATVNIDSGQQYLPVREGLGLGKFGESDEATLLASDKFQVAESLMPSTRSVAEKTHIDSYVNSFMSRPRDFDDHGISKEIFKPLDSKPLSRTKNLGVARQVSSSAVPCTTTSLNVSHQSDKSGCKDSQSTPVAVQPGHTLDLLSFGLNEKLEVITILQEGWKVNRTFVKRVRAVIPGTEKIEAEEILHAVFGRHLHQFVEFDENERGNARVRMNQSYRTFEGIVHILKFFKSDHVSSPSAELVTDLNSSVILDHLNRENQPNIINETKTPMKSKTLTKSSGISKHSSVSSVSSVHSISDEISEGPCGIDATSSTHNLLFLPTSKKVQVLSILKKGFRTQDVILKEIRAAIPDLEDYSVQQIVSSVFNDQVSEFVEFQTNEVGMTKVRICPKYHPVKNHLILEQIVPPNKTQRRRRTRGGKKKPPQI